ncbi:MAG: hypothetical protein Q8T08_21720 [Ignavibacteria bacterium]|nr:hypothetical protein [Ignavibacteria bacterium]
MKNSGKVEKPFYLRAWTVVLGSLTVIGLLLGIFTNGFQIKDYFKYSDSVINRPVIDIRVDPFEYNFCEGGNYKTGKIAFTIQTSKGSYQLLDSMKFEKLIVIKPDFFIDDGKNANSILTKVTLDYLILDNRIPEEIGFLEFKNDFILKGDKVTELANSKQKETIGMIVFSIHYIFENEIYVLKKQIPIIVYFEDKEL